MSLKTKLAKFPSVSKLVAVTNSLNRAPESDSSVRVYLCVGKGQDLQGRACVAE
jgi:hypothetical protein